MQDPVQTSITGPDSEEEKDGEVPLVEGAIWKVTQVEVDFGNGGQAKERSIDTDNGAPGIPERGGIRDGETHTSSDARWDAGASEMPSETPRPSLQIDLRPSFKENREIFEKKGRILCR